MGASALTLATICQPELSGTPLSSDPEKKGKREDSTRESVWDEKALSEVA